MAGIIGSELMSRFSYSVCRRLMGATFSELLQSWRNQSEGVGRAAALNTMALPWLPSLQYSAASAGDRAGRILIAVAYLCALIDRRNRT